MAGVTIGLCYYYGIGVTRDKFKALQYFEQITREESEHLSGYELNEAHYILGKMYLDGTVVDQSIDKARQYLELADEDGDHRSALELLMLIGRSKTLD